VSFGVLATVVVACPPRALSANSHAWRLGNLPITVGLSFSWKFFVRNGVKTCCTDSLPHFGQRGWAPWCSVTCSKWSKISPHFSQRYW